MLQRIDRLVVPPPMPPDETRCAKCGETRMVTCERGECYCWMCSYSWRVVH